MINSFFGDNIFVFKGIFRRIARFVSKRFEFLRGVLSWLMDKFKQVLAYLKEKKKAWDEKRKKAKEEKEKKKAEKAAAEKRLRKAKLRLRLKEILNKQIAVRKKTRIVVWRENRLSLLT
jgi:hypothetical protein